MRFWRAVPLLKYLIFYLAGISLASVVSFEPKVLFIILLFVFIVNVSLHFYLKKRVQLGLQSVVSLGILIGFMVAGLLVTKSANSKQYETHFSQHTYKYLKLRVADKPQLKARSIGFKVEIIAGFDSITNAWQGATGMALVYVPKSDSLINYGDLVIVNSSVLKEVMAPSHKHHFNLQKYYSRKGITHSGFIKSKDYYVTETIEGKGILGYAFTVQKELREVFTRYFPNKDVKGVAEAVVFGYKEDLNDKWLDAFSKTGTIHVLAVSGLHVGIIYILLSSLLGLSKSKGRTLYLKAALILLMLFGYSLLTGFAPSVSRASLMFGLMLIAKVSGGSTNIYNTLCFAAFVLLAINPNNLFNVGFQFSFLAVLGIVFYKDRFKNIFPQKYWLGNAIFTLLAVSIAAQIATFPLGLYYFHQYPNLFMFSNLIVIPCITIIVYGGLGVALVSYVSPALTQLLADFVSSYIVFIADAVLWIQNLPRAFFEDIHITTLQLFLLYAAIILLTITLTRKWEFGWALVTTCVFVFLIEDYKVLKDRNSPSEVVHFQNNRELATIYQKGNEVQILGSQSYYPGTKNFEFQVRPYLVKERLTMEYLFRPIEATNFKQQADFMSYHGNGLLRFDNKTYLYLDNLRGYLKDTLEVNQIYTQGNRSKAYYKAVSSRIRMNQVNADNPL